MSQVEGVENYRTVPVPVPVDAYHDIVEETSASSIVSTNLVSKTIISVVFQIMEGSSEGDWLPACLLAYVSMAYKKVGKEKAQLLRRGKNNGDVLSVVDLSACQYPCSSYTIPYGWLVIRLESWSVSSPSLIRGGHYCLAKHSKEQAGGSTITLEDSVSS